MANHPTRCERGVNATQNTSKRPVTVLGTLLVLLVLMGCARLCVGYHSGWPDGNPARAVFNVFLGDWWPLAADHGLTVMDIRIKRVILAVLVGAALSASGVGLQALLRNPLAEPFILGLSSGAAVGIMLQSWLGQRLQMQMGGGQAGALVGALVSMAVVYAAGRRRGVVDPIGLLLVGVVLATINGALIMLLSYLSDPGGPQREITRWMMGQLDEGITASSVTMVTAGVVLGGGLLWWLGEGVDVATFSDVEAVSMGVDLRRLRSLLFVISGGLAAGAVMVAGPIAFVGLICPHLARLLVGPAHRPLLIGSVLIGAILLLVADTASTTIDFGQGRVPVGIFTAILGGPVFIWMLRSQLGRGEW